MRPSLPVLVSLVMGFTAHVHAQQTQDQAFTDAKTMAESVRQKNATSIRALREEDAKGFFSGYDPSAPEHTKYFDPSLSGQIGAAGVNEVNRCANYSGMSDPVRRAECNGVNIVALNPSIRPGYEIKKTDPIYAKIQVLRSADPKQYLVDNNILQGGGGSYTNCTQKTLDGVAQTNTEICYESTDLASKLCSVGKVVEVNADTNFQCDVTSHAYEEVSCTRTPNIEVSSAMSCTPGQYYSPTMRVDGGLGGDSCDGGDVIYFKYLCEETDTPTFKIWTNSKYGDFHEGNSLNVALAGNGNFNVTRQFSNCYSDFKGQISCSNGDCSGPVNMDVYNVSYPGQQVCDVYGECTYVTDYNNPQRGPFLGTYRSTVRFQIYTKTAAVTWPAVNNCSALEERAK